MASRSQSMVVGSSLTEASDGVVRTAAAAARATGARLFLVHAFTPPVLPAELGAMDPAWIEVHAQELRRRALAQAQRMGLAALPDYSPEQVRVVIGSPHQEIVRLAAETGADLVVVGAVEGGSRFAFLGSTADRVVRKAPPCAPCHKRACPTHEGIMRTITVEEVLAAVVARLAGARG